MRTFLLYRRLPASRQKCSRQRTRQIIPAIYGLANYSTNPLLPTSRFASFRPLSTISAQHEREPTRLQKKSSRPPDALPQDWDENPDLSISNFSQLPSTSFGVNQHMLIDAKFKEALRQILWQFRAPIRYAFAYGSGVFPQTASSATSSSIHPNPTPAIAETQRGTGKMIDYIFGVSFTEHWHSLNLHQHRDHYSALGSLGSGVIRRVQDSWGAGVYFNPYITVNGTLIKYGVVNLDTLRRDLSEWDTMYLAGRLQKPVKILRDDASVRVANQVNLISAVRTALLLLPKSFTEQELYSTIAGLSYRGDLRMTFNAENPHKVANIVKHQIANFRQLYAPLISDLPNVSFHDPQCNAAGFMENEHANARLSQDMDPQRRGNMVRRLPKAFRSRLYFRYQTKFQIPRGEFNQLLEASSDESGNQIKRRQAGPFELRVAKDEPTSLRNEVSAALAKTIKWPSTSQSIKGIFTGGFGRTVRYLREKFQKYRVSKPVADGGKEKGE